MLLDERPAILEPGDGAGGSGDDGDASFLSCEMKMRGRAVNYSENANIGSEGRVEAGKKSKR